MAINRAGYCMKQFLNIVITATLAAAPTAAGARTICVSLDKVASTLATTQSGDTIAVEPGQYANLQLKWDAPGWPLTVAAKEPGKTVITGKSSLKISGDSLTVAGLDFINAHPSKGSLIEFRNGDKLARHCSLTDINIENCNPSRRDQTSSYIVLHGQDNRVDHCSLTGKKNLGVTLLVNLNDARSLNNRHRVDHNYFGPRAVYGSNGAETMRIGTSQQAYETSATTVEDNFFDRCNGEVEIISVKSSGNTIRNNVFNSCEGVVALRHGRHNTVEGNIFNGNGTRNTGGVRVVDSHHKVRNNTFANLKGGRFFSALALMNSVPNSLPNRYVKVDSVEVTGNTFIDCSNIEFGTGRDMERTEHPENCRFTGNTVYTSLQQPYIFIDPEAGVDTTGNCVKALPATLPDVTALRNAAGATRKNAVNHQSALVDTIVLEPRLYAQTQTIIIDKPTHIAGNGAQMVWQSTGGGNFITICNGGSLTVSDITFNGALQQGFATARNAIATATDMIDNYTLEVDNCSFINFGESGCCAIRGTKGTFAPTITVTNCHFANLSGNGISLADETDDKGIYSADDINIINCTFDHMLGIPVNIYRGGSDESTAGPYVNIAGCTFTDCCNRERGSVLRLIGPQKLTVDGCRFIDSGRGGASIRLDETTWEDVTVTNCNWNNSGRVISNRNVII